MCARAVSEAAFKSSNCDVWKVAPAEGTDDWKALQAGWVPDAAAVQPGCGWNWGLDQRETADCDWRVLQGSHQHPGTHNSSHQQSEHWGTCRIPKWEWTLHIWIQQRDNVNNNINKLILFICFVLPCWYSLTEPLFHYPAWSKTESFSHSYFVFIAVQAAGKSE